MKRVFFRRIEASCFGFTKGNEYVMVAGKIFDDDGDQWTEHDLVGCLFERIERDELEPQTEWQALQAPTFEAHGFTWTKHVPGDPMPCDRDALVHCYVKENGGLEVSSPGTGKTWWWTDEGDETDIIGWRFAEETKPESTTITLKSAFAEKSHGVYEFHVSAEPFKSEGVVSISLAPEAFDWSIPPPPPLEISIADVMAHRQMVAMDIAQPESAGEKAYRLKQQAKQEAEAQKEQAKAEQMAQAGEVFSREYGSLNDHRLGCRPCF
jgi:hypothetical protein